MIEYIYNIIRILSDFEFKVWDYAKDGGAQVTSAAQKYYCLKSGITVSDNEVKEINRFISYKYEDKCKEHIWNKKINLTEGRQRLEIDLEGVHLVITADIRPKSIDLSIESPFYASTRVYDNDPNTSFLIQTATGKTANATAKEKISQNLAILISRSS